MRAEHVDAFVAGAFEVLGNQAGARPERGSPVLRSGGATSTRELTALVTVHGDLEGVTFYSMSLATAAKLAAVIARNEETGEEPLEDNAVAELARAVSLAASESLEKCQWGCTIDTPQLVTGFGAPLTQLSPVLIVPLFTEYGDIDIGIALSPAQAGAAETSAIPISAPAENQLTEPEAAAAT